MRPVILSVMWFFLASFVAYILAAGFSTQFVLAALPTPVSWEDRWSMSLYDMVGLRTFLIVIMIAYAIAFIVAALVRRFWLVRRTIAFALAGSVAIGSALGLMFLQYDTVPISGARSVFGFVAQMVAGAVGGYIFGRGA